MHERLIAQLAASQHAVVSLDQLLRAGVQRSAIDRRLASGRLVRLHEGVYAVGGSVASLGQQRMAAVLAVGPSGALSHRAAASAHGCWHGACPIEVSVPREQAPRLRGVIVHRSRDLLEDHVTLVEGIRTTTPARTLVDVGQVVSWWTVGDVVDRMLRRKHVTPHEIRAAVALHSRRGRRGIGPLRRALDQRQIAREVTESALEDAFAALIERSGLPLPVPQHRVVIDGRERRIDFAYPELLLAIELDGYDAHVAPDRFEDDRVRANELAALGWQVIRFTWHQVVHQPQYVQQVIRRALNGRDGQVAPRP